MAEALRVGISPYSMRVLDVQNIDVAVTGTLVETELYSFTVPGGIMGPKGQIEVIGLFGVTNNANAKNLQLKFGGTQFGFRNLTNSQTMGFTKKISNRNSESSNIGTYPFFQPWEDSSGVSAVISAINTAVDQIVQVSAQLGNISDTAALRKIAVMLYKPFA